MAHETTSLLPRLVALIARLQTGSAGFMDNHQDAQQWYDRGYAAGMIAALDALGHGATLGADIERDAPELMSVHGVMSWGKAYRHGQEVGDRETREVLAPEQIHGHALSNR